jgi:periplasmic protein TonB
VARRNKARSVILGVSIGLHVVLGTVVALLPADKVREVVAIAFADAPPPKRAKPAPPKAPDAARSSQALAARMRTTASTRAAAAAPESSSPTFTDLGLALDSSSTDGLAVPVAPRPVAVPIRAAQVQSQPKLLVARPRTTECTDPLVKPVVEKLARPEYTDEALAAKVEGRIRLELTVDEQGAVSAARILQGLGYGLDEAALAAAQQIRFRPATRCSRPVAAAFVLALRFMLNS